VATQKGGGNVLIPMATPFQHAHEFMQTYRCAVGLTQLCIIHTSQQLLCGYQK